MDGSEGENEGRAVGEEAVGGEAARTSRRCRSSQEASPREKTTPKQTLLSPRFASDLSRSGSSFKMGLDGSTADFEYDQSGIDGELVALVPARMSEGVWMRWCLISKTPTFPAYYSHPPSDNSLPCQPSKSYLQPFAKFASLCARRGRHQLVPGGNLSPICKADIDVASQTIRPGCIPVSEKAQPGPASAHP